MAFLGAVRTYICACLLPQPIVRGRVKDSALVYSAPHPLASKLHLWCTENRYLVSPDTLPSDCLTSVLRGGTAKLLVPIAIARIARPSCKRSFVRIPIPLPDYIGFWMESLLLSSAPLGAVYHPD